MQCSFQNKLKKKTLYNTGFLQQNIVPFRIGPRMVQYSIENVNIHAIHSQRCRLQFRLSNDIQTHLPIGDNRKNFGFVMNEFGLQRLCFKLIN